MTGDHMGRKSETKRIRRELVIEYIKEHPTEGYDGMVTRVNQAYAETGDIRQTIKDTGLPFDLVWEMVGFKDQMDFMDMRQT